MHKGGCVTRWSVAVNSRPRVTLVAIIVLVAVSGLWGLGVLDRLNLAGYEDTHSESAEVESITNKAFGAQTPDIIVVYTAPTGKTLDNIRPEVVDRLNAVTPDVLAKPVESYWTSDILRRTAFVSSDGRKALAALTLKGSDSDRLRAYPELAKTLSVSGVKTQISGFSALTDEFTRSSNQSVTRAETYAIPLTLLLLVLIFGGLIAASIPVLVGGLTIFGSLGALRALSMFTDVSAFAVTTASLLGLGLSIDYGLFMVSRFREELAQGHDPFAASRNASRTAGRTIVFSGVLLMCAFVGTIAFPVALLRSIAFGAMSAVAIAVVLSTLALPAALSLLGSRINALTWRRGATDRGEVRAQRVWGALAVWVMRRPVAVTLVVMGALLVLSAPLAHVQLAGVDPNLLPKDSPVRVAQQAATNEFPNANSGATILLRGESGAPPSSSAIAQVTDTVERREDVRMVINVGESGDLVLLRALLRVPDFTRASEDSVRGLREIPVPQGTIVRVGGLNAIRADSYDSIVNTLPTTLAIMVIATLLVLFVCFRSIVLPIKAVLLGALSLSATFGILAWVFQQGHGASLLGVEPAPLPFPALVVVVAAVFGLSTDYEVFLMSRMREAREGGATTEEAVRVGLARTGRVITAAALLFIVVTAAAATSPLSLIKIAAGGMALAIFIDATIVRMLLVPAVVKLMGEANWWSPFDRKARTVYHDESEVGTDSTGVEKEFL